MKKSKLAMIRHLILAGCLVASLPAVHSLAAEPNIGDYTAYPAFMSQSVKPDILIMLDNSGSMNQNAYGSYPGDYGTVTDAPYFPCGIAQAGVAESADDAEEYNYTDTAWYDSDDLDLGGHTITSGDAIAGIRFQGVAVPPGATITSAYIEFEAYASDTAASSFIIQGEASDHAKQFSATTDNITVRSTTEASVSWDNVEEWTAGSKYRTPDLAAIVQEVVNRSGWSLNNAMVFKISGKGRRDAKSYDNGDPSLGPVLHIEYKGECPRYYGYFNPDARYSYSSNLFTVDPNGAWDGNWLNWLCMRRIDVARKVLMGGLATARTGGGNQNLIGEAPAQVDKVFSRWYDSTGESPSATPYIGNYKYTMQGGYIKVYDSAGIHQEDITIRVAKDIANEPEAFDLSANLAGVLQKVGDKARWGNMWFDEGTGSNDSGGFIASVIGTNMISLITDLQNTKADTYTPLAEAYYVAMQYFKQEDPATGLDYANNIVPHANDGQDPFYNGSELVPCAKSFVILLTDGVSTKDSKIPDFLKDYDGDGDKIGCDEASGADCDYPSGGTDYLDDVALYARTNDLRADLEGDQSLILYTIYAFGSDDNARSLLKDAARNGGFIDRNGNSRPDGDYADPPQDRIEWDKNEDGNPDTYFEAKDGYKLEKQLIKAINDILARAASGTSASVLATTSEGEGNLIQAYFRPTISNGTMDLTWTGHLHSLWVDAYGRLCEDTVHDYTFKPEQDKVITFYQDGSGNTKVKRFSGANPDVQNDAYEELALEEITPVWDAGEMLAQKDPDDRNIFTYIDSDRDGEVDEAGYDSFDDNGEVIRFHTGAASAIKPYLGIRDAATWSYLGKDGVDNDGDGITDEIGEKDVYDHDRRVELLINYIRGIDYHDSTGRPALRNRTIDGTVWKLGDIVNSTPVSVSTPPDNFHIIYSDESYQDFFNRYKNRETMVYVGANDGMLHAFTSWSYDSESGQFKKPAAAPATERIGDELWSFIPQSLLPHLKWLADPDYTHVYYVDLKPKVFDAKILPDGTHSGINDGEDDWGTILLIGLNMGGKHIWSQDDFGSGLETRDFYPSYVCMDVTEPRNPRLLWERTYTNLAMSRSIPAVVKVQDQWFAVFGSGPTDYDGTSSQKGHIFVVDLKTGKPYPGTGSTGDWFLQTGEANALINSPVAFDKNLNYNVDAVYFGETFLLSGAWRGKAYKMTIPCSPCQWDDGHSHDFVYKENPSTWPKPAALFDSPGPITAPLAVSVDVKDNVWLYFGTGRFISADDKLDAAQQYLFGMKDPFFLEYYYSYNAGTDTYDQVANPYYHNYAATRMLDISNLFNVDSLAVKTDRTVLDNGNTYGRDGTFRELVMDIRGTDGWVRSLAASNPSERCVTKQAILGGIVIAPTYTPDIDICGYGGETNFYAIFYETGTAYPKNVWGGTQEIAEIKKGPLVGPPPPDIGIHVGLAREAMAFSQQSTGEIGQLPFTPALNFRSNLFGWQEP